MFFLGSQLPPVSLTGGKINQVLLLFTFLALGSAACRAKTATLVPSTTDVSTRAQTTSPSLASSTATLAPATVPGEQTTPTHAPSGPAWLLIAAREGYALKALNLSTDDEARVDAVDWAAGAPIDLGNRISGQGWIALRSGLVELQLYKLPSLEPVKSMQVMNDDLLPTSQAPEDYPYEQYYGVSAAWAAPMWSPQEPVLAFNGAMDDAWVSVYTLDTETDELTRITEGTHALVLGWSPDGRYLVYATVEDIRAVGYRPIEVRVQDFQQGSADAQIWAMGQHPLEVIGWISQHEFLFSERRPDGLYRRLIKVDLKSNEREILMHDSFHSAVVDPISRTVAIDQAPGVGGGSVLLLTVDPGGARVERDVTFEHELGALRWYPSFAWFAVETSGGTSFFDVDGTILRTFTDEKGLPVPSPDGRWLAFGPSQTLYDSSLRVYTIDGELLTETKLRARDVAWWPDSEGILFLRSEGGLWGLELASGRVRQASYSTGWELEIFDSDSMQFGDLAYWLQIQGEEDLPLADDSSTPGPTPLLDTVLGPGAALTLVDLQMQDAQRGWGRGRAVGDRFDRVLVTEDGGETWHDVTPPKNPTPPQEYLLAHAYGEIQDAVLYALDAQHAWVTYEAPTDGLLRVWRTVDAGQSWRVSDPVSFHDWGDFGPWVDAYEPIAMDFPDAEHGWIQAVTELPASMMAADYVLLRTEDGGGTWDFIGYSATCGPEGMVFLDRDHGWMLETCDQPEWSHVLRTSHAGEYWYDDPEVPVGLELGPFQMRDVCWAAYDLERLPGGWVKMILWCPEDVRYPREGLDQARNVLYLSQDLGLNWLTSILPTRVRPDGAFSTDFISADVGWLLEFGGGALYQTANRGASWRFLKNVAWEGDLHFVDPMHGWAIAWEKGVRPPDRELSLVRTQDGGYTWELLEPRAR